MATPSVYPLEALPPNVLQHIVLYLPDPGPFAATCSSIASQLDQQALQLAWAEAWAPRLTGDSSEHRHPGYTLLQWRRYRCWDTARLVALLQRWVERSHAPAAADSAQQVQHLLDTGDPLAALQALLPHSEYVLLLYTAQAGHMRLLGHLLGQRHTAAPVRLQWDTGTFVDCCLLVPAAFAAVRSGQVDALHMLLAAVAASNVCATAEDLGTLHFQLLHEAIKGGRRSESCVAPLLQLCQGPQWPQLVCQLSLPPFTKTASSTTIRTVLSAVASWDPLAAYELALLSGQVQLLPQLRPASLSNEDAARHALSVARQLTTSGNTTQLQHLAQAMLHLASGNAHALWLLCDGVMPAISLNNIPALQFIWATFAAPAASAKTRVMLARSMLHALCMELHTEGLQPATVQWCVDHALPVVNSTPHERRCLDALDAAAYGCLKTGRFELLAAFQAPDQTAALISQQPGMRQAKVEGHVHAAVRRGEAAAVRLALQTLQAYLAGEGLHSLGSTGVVEEALWMAAQLPDAAAAEAVVRVLAPFLDEEAGEFEERLVSVCRSYGLLTAHGGAMLRALADASAPARACIAGPESCNFLLEACAKELPDLAQWLVAHPDQRGNYLGGIFWVHAIQPWNNTLTESNEAPQLLRSFTQLLYSLAVRPCPQASSSRSSSGGAGDDSSGVSAGARQLTHALLSAVAYSGMPDMLHALLVLMDTWSPLRQ